MKIRIVAGVIVVLAVSVFVNSSHPAATWLGRQVGFDTRASLRDQVASLHGRLDDQKTLIAVYKAEIDDLQSLARRMRERYPPGRPEPGVLKSPPPRTPPPGALSLPRIDGQVVAVNAEQGIVVLSVGSDDGVESGREFSVLRDGEFLGTVRATKVTADLSGARIVDFKGDRQIQVGDTVTTRVE